MDCGIRSAVAIAGLLPSPSHSPAASYGLSSDLVRLNRQMEIVL